ncbi:MAG: hypothetical protein AMJ46_12655 [Latescibacteria bacterium DG_63]|nr:MAG: hypothetical protein AMJ46_12655 [Latescibacteria bacterium DG_63]
MSFLTLNGATIPVADCQESVQELGERGRVFGGKYNLARRTRKRKWDIRTPPLNPSRARAIAGMVDGVGHCWRFDDATLYDFKGRSLDVSGSRFTALLDLSATKDDPVYSGVIQYGRQSIKSEIEPTRYAIASDRISTNLLLAVQRKMQVGSAAQFVAMDGAAKTEDTDHSWAGSYGLKIVTSAAVNSTKGGVYSVGVATTAARFVTGSVYLYSEASAAADRTIEVYLSDSTNAAFSTFVTVAIPQDKWTRVVIPSFWCALASANMNLVVRESVADSGLTWWCDGFQIEEHATEKGASAWVDGARASVDLVRLDNANFFGDGDGDFTFNCWASNSELGTAQNDRYLFYFSPTAAIGGSNPRAYAYRDSSAGTLNFGVNNGAGDGASISYAWDPEQGDGYDIGQMSMLTFVVRRDKQSGEYDLELWVDGALVGSGNNSYEMPDLRQLANDNGRGWLGTHSGEAAPWCGSIDDFAVLPFAADANTIAGWYARGEYSDVPKYVAAGDMVGGDAVEVVGRLGGLKNAPFRDSGTYLNNAKVVAFTLLEA